MADPLSDIEDRQDAVDMGVLYYRIYIDARQDGASHLDALLVVAAMCLATIRNAQMNSEEGGDDESQV